MDKKLTLILLVLATLANAGWAATVLITRPVSQPIMSSALPAIAAGLVFLVTSIWFLVSNSDVVAAVGSLIGLACDAGGILLLFIGAPTIMFPLLFMGVGGFLMWSASDGQGAWVERGWTGLIILACGAIWLLSNWF